MKLPSFSPRFRRAVVEPLEARIAPAANAWIGAGSGNWNTPGNWSDGVPTADDVVTINPAGTLTITIDSGAQVAASLTMPGDDKLTISGGSLTLTAVSTIHDLALGGSGSLLANAAVSLTGAGSFSSSAILGGSAVVTNNGTLGITSGEPNLQTELVNANGATITQGNAFLDLDGAAGKLRVVSGGVYESVNTASGFGLRALGGTTGFFVETGGVFRHASPNGASFDVAATVPFNVNGGTLQNTGAAGTALNLGGIGTFTNATLVPSISTTINFGGTNNTIVGSITGSGAGVVNLAGGQLHADAAGATLNFPAGLFNWSGTGVLSGPGVFTNMETIQLTGGEPDLATELLNLGTIKHGNAFLDLDGAAAKLRLVSGGLYESVNTASGFGFRALNGTPGVFVEAGGVFSHASSNGATFDVAATVPFDVNGGTLQNNGVAGTALNLGGVGTFTSATLAPSVGTTINFTGTNNTIVGSITGSGAGVVNLAGGQLHATAAGAALNFPAGLFNWSGTGVLSGPGVFTNTGTIQITGGEPDLATELLNVGTIKHGNAFLDLDGAAAKLRLVSGGLYESVNTASGFGFRALNGTPGVFVEAGGVFRHASSNGASFAVAAAVPFDVNGGTLQNNGVAGTALNLGGIGTFTNAILSPSAGTTINFNGNNNTIVGSITGSGAGVVNLAGGQLHATAAGATLNFPAGLFNWSGTGVLSGPGAFTNTGTIQITGGEPDLATELVNVGKISHGNAFLDLDGASSELRVIAGGVYESVNTASGFGLRALNGPAGFFVEAGGVFRHASSNGASFDLAAAVPFKVNGGTLQNNGVAGSALNLSGVGAFTNATFAPATGTTINFGGNNNTIIGTLNGSGAGVVNLAGGQLHATATGATLNFAAGVFNFSGTGNLSGPGNFTNAGTMQITGGEPNLQTELVNAGTIRHGNAFLDLDGATAKVRLVSGGVYESVNTASGFGIRALGGAAGIFVEAGATFFHNTSNGAHFNTGAGVAFSNLGTVVVANGALNFATAPAQISGAANAATLGGGAWEVANGATLNLGITGLRTNATDITVRGTGTFIGLGELATNSGALTLLEGVFVATAAFANSGLVHLGEGSVLAAPSFTQTAAGVIEFELGGTTVADYGRLAITNAATLGGTARVQIASDYSPAIGDVLTLATYASRSGNFASFEGMNLTRTPVFAPFIGANTLTLASLVNAANLGAVSITAPASGFAGQDFAISYTVGNASAFPTVATTWTDTIYLSLDDVLDPGDIVLTRVTHTGVVAAGGSYTENITVPLTGTITGAYKVLVLADSRGFVADPDRADNLAATTISSTLDIPQLTDGVAVNGTIRAGQQLWYRLTLAAGETPNFIFTGAVAGEAEIYTSFGEVPTRADFLQKGFSQGSAVQQIVADVTAAGTYYVLLHGRESAGVGQSFSLVGEGVGFDLASTSLTGGANIGRATATLTGSQFSPGTTFTLVPTVGAPRAAEAVYFVNARTVHATFDLTGLAAGAYDIVATKGLASDALDDVFTVTSGGTPGTLQYSVSSPSFVRPQGGTVTITFQNIGGTDLDAPLFNLLAENARLRLAGETTFLGGTFLLPSGQPLTVVELLGVSGGLAGILSPGERGSIELSFQAINSAVGAIAKFEALAVGATSDPVDFSGLKDDLRPAGVGADAWDAVFTNFQAGVGGTTASYRDMLVENANYLGQFGPVSADATRLVEFELEQAGEFGAIAARYTLGELGRGNAGPFSLQATTEADGGIVLSDGLTARAFSALVGGAFAGTNLDGGKLTRGIGGALTLTEATGEKMIFRASDGRLDFVEDPNGNRVTAARNASGQLLTLTESVTGDVTTFTHNAQGRIATVTDEVGRVTTYGYDAGGEHLTSITTPRGTTSYTYTATGHAIASVTDLNGLTTSFAYDTFGRLATQTIGTGGDALVTSFDYDDAGGLTATEPGARETHLFRTLGGDLARSIDPLGNVTSTSYDALGRIVGVTDASGLTTKTSLDAKGLLSGFQNMDRTQVGIDLGGDLLRLQSVTDPGGDSTHFAYDALGNLLSTTRPDGATERFEYDADGRVTAATDANGQRATFTYDADGLVTRRAFSGGTQIDYTYDAHRNLLTATDAEGTTTFTYDAADRRTSVAYPNGTSVAITYDAQGRRATVADQTGYTVRYSYDSLSRLDQVRDTANALLVDYGYDALGQLASETRGNGSATAYTYDGDGRVATITHRDAASAVTGNFTYTYDAQDRVQTVTTAAGTTTYTYDLTGQLTQVELPAGRTITYAYDAEGNRTSVTDSAAGTESYTTNNGDQYTTAGEEALTYDGEGRILTRTQGGVTTSYTYSALGQLTGITAPGSVTTFDYDALGNRIGKTVNGVRTDYAQDPSGLGVLFGEYNGPASTHYASGLGIAARESAGSTAFYHYDAAGNTALVSGAAGAAVVTYTYLPFGEIAGQTGSLAQPFTFNGQFGIQDDPGDLFHMRARAYDAELGRFTTRDPIGFSSGDTNAYRFVQNDPVNFADPSGLLLGLGILETLFLETTGTFGSTLELALFAQELNLGLAGAEVTTAFVGANAAASAPLTIPAAGGGGAGGQVARNVVPRLAAHLAPAGPGTLAGVTGAGLLTAAASVGTGLVLAAVVAPKVIGGFESVDNFFRDNRDAHAGALGYPDGNESHFSPDFVREAGKNPYFTEIVRKGIADGLSQEDAILDAIRIIKKLGLEDETGPGTPSKTESRVVRPSDPNNVIGPAGAGADPVPAIIAPGQFRFDGFVSGTADFGYTIQFENQPSATAPAQVVKVTQTLDAGLDFSTFRFGSFGFGDFKIDVPAGADGTSFETVFDATATHGVLVQIEAELNTISGLLEVTFTSLDPATNEVPADPFAGFLPANLTAPEGDGFLTYFVAPDAGLANATVFTAIASIVFDTENAIATPTVTNTLDTLAPTSALSALPATTSRTTFVVRWTGADDVGGSGLAGITLFYTDNGGPLLTATVANADGGFRFAGAVGHTYAFFSQAVDNVGNTSVLPGAAERTITIVAPTLIPAKDPNGKLHVFTDTDGDTYTVALTGPGTLNAVLLDPDGNGKGPLDQLFLTGSTDKSKVTVAVKRAKDGPDLDKLPDGDGIVTIGDLNVTGDLAAFTAKASDLTVDGIVASGFVGAVSVRDILPADVLAGVPGVTGGGTALTKTKFALTARTIGDGTFHIGNPAAFIKAASIGDAFIAAPSLGALSTSVGAMNADLTIAGKIGAITVKTGANGGLWSAANFGAVTLGGALDADIAATGNIGAVIVKTGNLSGDIDVNGKITSASVKAGSINGQLTAATIGAVSITGGGLGGFIGASAAPGKVKGLASLVISGGDLTGSVLVTGNAGPITVKENAKTFVGGNISGPISANSFATVALTGGGLSGTLDATGTALALGKTLALSALSITGGDLAGDVRLFGGAGAISVKADKLGNGGNITDINLTAAKLASLTVARDITDAIILAGADLGADHEWGGGDDTFGAGTIGAISIGSKIGAVTFGNVIASVIAAGLSNPDGTPNNGDDTIFGATLAEKLTSKIASLVIKGADITGSYFAAGKFTAIPKVGGVPVVFPNAQFRTA